METKINITKLSSKGQVVIPRELRINLNIKDGALFAVTSQGDNIVFSKIEMPKVKTWKEAVRPFREAAQKSKFTREDLDKLILEHRAR
jgi:AbrB family looped-hinge helix DNA binding protein